MRYRLNHARLTQLLSGSKISQNHWAIKLGFSRGHWSDIVNGRHPYPSTKTRERMLEVFEVGDLFTPEVSAPRADVDFRIAISGRYELTNELGHGGMGAVFLANDLALGRTVALKVVSTEAIAGVGPDQLLKEIAVVSRLQHPNILPLFDAGTGAGSPYYVMPLVRAGSLGARLKQKGRLPLAEVVHLVAEIAAGLQHAHSHRVLHCDIKPENILVDGDHPYVMDFGIARTIHSEANEWIGVRKELDFSAGTPAYVSPEQAAGDRAIDGRSDVYSLACVAYEMLTGRTAFAGNNTQEIISLRFREPPPPLQQFAPDVPYAVASAIEHAMALDPAQRPQTVMAFAQELSHAARTASVVRTAVGVGLTRIRRWARRLPGAADRRAQRGGFMKLFDTIKQDLVYAIRQRRRSPALTAMSLATLALGIGLTTAVFALVDATMLRPLPYPHQSRLVALESVDSVGNNIEQVSSANWYDWRNENRTLEGVALYTSSRVSVTLGENALRVESAQVSPEFFSVIGARLIKGHAFDSADVAAGRGGVVVSEGFWRRELGARRDSLPVIRVNGYPTQIIGIVAAGQSYPPGIDVWTAYRHRQMSGVRNNINWLVVGRLREGVSIPAAATDLNAIARRIHNAEPQTLYTYGVNVIPLHHQLVGSAQSLLELLAGAVVLVMLVACSNLATANLAQGAQRQREMAVRSALGAGRKRLVRQVLVENVALALIGGSAGVAVAWLLIKSASGIGMPAVPSASNIGIDARVLIAALVLSSLAGIFTGILPAMQAARAAPNDVIGGGMRGFAIGGRGLPGRVLVGAEIALALILVTGAGLLVRSLQTVLAQPLGYQTQHIVTARITLGGPRYQNDSAALISYWENLLQTVRQTPGVEHATAAQFVPMVLGGSGFIDVEGKDLIGAGAGYRIVAEDYLETLGMTLREGRTFSSADTRTSPRTCLINSLMAAKFWPGESPIGKRVRANSMEPATDGSGHGAWITVIGVVNDVRHFGYDSDPAPEMFVMYRQLPIWRLTTMTALVRGTAADGDMIKAVRSAVAAADASVPADIDMLDAAAQRSTAPRRFASSVIGAFGLLALVLAGIGVYGVLSFSVAQRTREMAIRAALGADRKRLLRFVFGSGAIVVFAGVAVGLAGALVASKLIESLLFNVSPRDPIVLLVAALIITATGLLAAFIPARRAMRADPIVAMRAD